MGIPQVTVVHGSSTAGGAYQPGLSDYVVVVRGKAKMFSPGRRCSRPPPARSPATRNSAEPNCTRRSPAPRNTWRKTTPTACAWPARSSALPWNAQRRRARRVPGANRCTRWRSCSGGSGRPEEALRRPRDRRAHRRRLRVPRLQERVRRPDRSGHLRIEGRRRPDRQQRTDHRAAKAAQFIQLCERATRRCCSCTTPPASWSVPSRSARA